MQKIVSMEDFMFEIRRLANSTTQPILIVFKCEVTEHGKTEFKDFTIGNEKYIEDNDWYFSLIKGTTKESLGVHDILDIVENEALDDCWDNDIYSSRYDNCIQGDVYFCFDMENRYPRFVLKAIQEVGDKLIGKLEIEL